jgi:LmbE family N-acetylglucosaminyl deacetylase
MNVLCVIAHPDDEILGVGGTLRKLRDRGHNIYSCVLCGPADARHARPSDDKLREVIAKAEGIIGITDSIKYEFGNIRFNTVPHIEMVAAIEKAIVKFQPSWVFTHHPGDLNVDHRVCYEATMAATMLPQRLSTDLPPSMIERVFLFEILSSTDWAPSTMTAFQPNSFFDIRDTFDAKLQALAAFEGAMKPFPHSRSLENVKHLAHLRGGQVGIELAEAFVLVRDLNR